MNYNKSMNTFKSSNHSSDITYYIYKPISEPKGIVQLSHGMCEYIERYEDFIDFLTGHGFIVCGNDHLGHGKSADSKDKLGYFAPVNGWSCLVDDLSILTKIMKEQYSNLPIFLFGHSMGSFIARIYMTRYSDLIQGAIICGTSGSNPLLGAGKVMIQLVQKLKGPFYRSKFIRFLMFGSYNSKFEKPRTHFDWLTNDPAIIDAYMKDEYCNFIFTSSAFSDLATLLDTVSQDSWYHAVPKKLPLYLISGDMDPVGNWGKGIEEVKKRLKKENLEDFSSKFYKDFRHEILNEIEKDEVYKDVLIWLNQRI